MQFIHNGVLINRDDNVLLDKWETPDITGDIVIDKPGYCIFNNTKRALEMLQKHIILKSKIALHIDVDVDGIGSGYILTKFLCNHGANNLVHMINKGKVHGIQDKHINWINNSDVGLVIVSDSSSNEIDLIKSANCDILVIDHHEILHNDLHGKCNDGVHDYIIVNNVLENTEFNQDILWLRSKNIKSFNNTEAFLGDNRMSCGLVIYELLRVYCECFSSPNLLENLMLYQWAGVTLLTDAIQLKTPRNQWYLERTVHNSDVEHSLKIMQQNITKWKSTLDKTYINYTFGPIINKAIRANAAKDALKVCIFEPHKIMETLDKYKKDQEDAVNKIIYTNYEDLKNLKDAYKRQGLTEEEALKELRMNGYVTELVPRKFESDTIMVDISLHNISPNYTGVIAGRLSGENNKNAVCYVITEDGKAKGSFRGRIPDTDYRKYFEEYSDDIYAQGHPPAFGFECRIEQLVDIMNNINSIEKDVDTREFFSVGQMPESEMGIFHIVDFQEFKRNMYLIRIANGNAKLTSTDEIYIKVPARDVILKEIKGKLYIYDVLGLECKAFKQLSGEYFKLYLEYTNELNSYIKPI